MKKIILSFIILILGVGICYAGKLSSYPFTAVLQNGDYFPIVVLASDTNQNINWTNLKVLVGSQITGINWTADALLAQGRAGINWQSLDIGTGATNWLSLAGQSTQGQIMCWNMTAGRPGKCTTIAGNNCATCN